MADVGGNTELQRLEQEIAILKKQLDGVQAAENTSVSCARIATNIQKLEGNDGFLVKDGGVEPNQYHITPVAEAGCCAVL